MSIGANKRIQKLIVGEAYVLGDRPALGGIADNNWVPGKIQIFKADYSVYDPAGADSAYDGPIAIGRYDEERDVYFTEFLNKGTFKGISVEDYTAPVLQRTDVDLTSISPVQGEIVGVQLANTANREVVYKGRRRYEVNSTGTLQDDIDAVAAAITADPYNDATAARSGDVLQITAAPYDPAASISEPSLSISTLEGWSTVTPALGVAAVSGIGTPDKIGLIESQEDWGESQGVGNRREFVNTPPSYVNNASTYNLITLEFNTSWGGNGGTAVGATAPKTVITAMYSAGTGAAAFKTALETWLNIKIDDQPDEA